MKRALAVVGSFALALGSACGKSTSNSLVVVTVSAPAALTPVMQLKVVLTNDLATDTLFFPEASNGTHIDFDATFAVSLPKSRHGDMEVAIDALDVLSNVVATGNGNVTINVGGRADTAIHLVAITVPDAGVPDVGPRDVAVEASGGKDVGSQADGPTPDVSLGPDGAGAGGNVGTGGITGAGGAVGTGGQPGTGGRFGAGGAGGSGTGGNSTGGASGAGSGGATGQGGTSGLGSGGTAGNDAGTGGVVGTGGIVGTGGATVPRDAGTTAGDAPASCYVTIVSNGYACGSTPACSACKDNGTSKEAECKQGIDCMAAVGASCDSNCQMNCLNRAGNSVVQACIKSLQVAACTGSGCGPSN
jgi:hypothetical protein